MLRKDSQKLLYEEDDIVFRAQHVVLSSPKDSGKATIDSCYRVRVSLQLVFIIPLYRLSGTKGLREPG